MPDRHGDGRPTRSEDRTAARDRAHPHRARRPHGHHARHAADAPAVARPGVARRQHGARERARDPEDPAHLLADPADAAAALTREVPRRPLPHGAAAGRDAAMASRSRTTRSAASPGVWVRPPHRPRATILYLHGGGYLATTPVDVLALHRRARARHRLRPLHRGLPPRARVPLPGRAARRDAGVRGTARRRPATERALRRRRLRGRRSRRPRCSKTCAPSTCPSPPARSCSRRRWTW